MPTRLILLLHLRREPVFHRPRRAGRGRAAQALGDKGRGWGDDPRQIDYGKIYENRFKILALACERGWERDAEAVAAFERENAGWLPDYALFMALKRRFGMKSWLEWPDEAARMREPEALDSYRIELAEDIRLFTYAQFLFFRQWNALRDYVPLLGIDIVGDLPIYVATDSATSGRSRSFSSSTKSAGRSSWPGCRPTASTPTGQLWGNALYDWDALKSDGYGWWNPPHRGRAEAL